MPEQFLSVASRVTSTSATAVLQPSTSATHVLRTLTLCNTSTSSTASATVSVFISDETASYVLFDYTQVTASQTVLPVVTPIVITAGNRMDISRVGSDLDVSASYLELS